MKTIVLARVEQTKLVETGRSVRRDGNYFPELALTGEAKACVWLNRGNDEDLAKARQFAATEGYTVFTFPTSERDPLTKAKALIMR